MRRLRPWFAAVLVTACAAPPTTDPAVQPATHGAATDAGSEVASGGGPRARARELGLEFGPLPPGPHNAITDVDGVRVGHATIVEGTTVRTGVTVVLPHGGNPFADKVPAALHVANGFGKLAGATQLQELGELESPIALCSTLSVPRVADGLLDWLLALPGNERVRSINVVVGETNDGRLNDVRGRHATSGHVAAALAAALGPGGRGPVAEGCVGAGTGTVCFGWKGGIGTSSRVADGHTLGVLVQSNFGGRLRLAGVEVGAEPAAPARTSTPGMGDRDGSCMIVVATDAPLDAFGLRRLAARAFAGMARIGASFSNGSGDYAIAFSTAESVRRRTGAARAAGAVLTGSAIDPLFAAVADATEEAIANSLCMAVTTEGCGRTVPALPLDQVRAAAARAR